MSFPHFGGVYPSLSVAHQSLSLPRHQSTFLPNAESKQRWLLHVVVFSHFNCKSYRVRLATSAMIDRLNIKTSHLVQNDARSRLNVRE